MIRLKALLSFGNSIDPSCKFPLLQISLAVDSLIKTRGLRRHRNLDDPRGRHSHDLRLPPRHPQPASPVLPTDLPNLRAELLERQNETFELEGLAPGIEECGAG